MFPEILYEDNHLIAVNKDAGVLSQRDSSGEDSLIEDVKSYIKEKYARPGNVFVGTVHRLDRPVTGVVLLARTSKAASRLFSQFSGRSVVRVYLALVHGRGRFSSEGWGRLEQSVKRVGDRTVIALPGERGAADAVLLYRQVSVLGGYSLLMVRLVTGRKHQIRAQLASVGMPIAGDGKYGSPEKWSDGSIGLHSFYLRFIHPVKMTVAEITGGVPLYFLEKAGGVLPLEKIIGLCREIDAG